MTVPALVLAAALGMMAVERRVPGRPLPRVRGWWPRAILLNAVQAGVVVLAGVLWDDWLRAHRPWSADRLGLVGGVLAGYLAITFVYYWWHRARHAVPFLWRWLHQVHHSPQRLEVATSFYKHPLEMLANGLLSSAILYVGVGLGPQAAGATVLLTGLAELVYHWNVRTPHAMGLFFQRPEMHCVHHQEGRHADNYADLPLWDLLFGTYHNPRVWRGRCGLGPEAEGKLLPMLRGVDVAAAAQEGVR